ncbi:MAG: hypothetical protein OJJ55_06610 [Rhodococcus sp.]|nr:hypothetical protein [Rhodococcus sp. (in: high G+C Gram-positive bacteria)]
MTFDLGDFVDASDPEFSDSELEEAARQVRAEVRRMRDEGKSDEEIIEHVMSRLPAAARLKSDIPELDDVASSILAGEPEDILSSFTALPPEVLAGLLSAGAVRLIRTEERATNKLRELGESGLADDINSTVTVLSFVIRAYLEVTGAAEVLGLPSTKAEADARAKEYEAAGAAF